MRNGEMALAGCGVFCKERQRFPPLPRGQRQEKAKGLIDTHAQHL